MLKFEKKSKTSSKIPMASTADIIFLLLIFFMTVTVFKEFQGFRVELPSAKATKKIEARRQITNLWIDAKNRINVDDMIITFAQVRPVVREKMIENPATIVSIWADQSAKYRSIALVMEELKGAQALRVNFTTKSK
jgi:biopolymer transport protein ExbD